MCWQTGESNLKIENSLALVTGGAKGLGYAISKYLQDRRAKVVVVDIDGEALNQLGSEFEHHVLDVTRPEEAIATVRKICDQNGPINVLVNNAGVIYSELMVNIMHPNGMMHDYERFRANVTVNMDSVFIMTSAVVEQMVTSRTKGCIVNISSISARGNEGQTAYSAAKAGVNAMTVTWSKELGHFGIRCNAVAPGFISTDSTHTAVSESIISHVTKNTPLRRLGQTEEVAHAVTLLIENDFMTGVVLDVNGGLTI